MRAVDYEDYLNANFIIFPLHPIVNGKCSCERENCDSPAKHPKASNWQHTQPYDEDQLEYLEDAEGIFFGNQLLDHYGVLVDGKIVVDVDGRNGGFESAKKLQHIRDQCEFIVRTGSGSGEHWYFDGKDAGRLAQSLAEYPGIDFKSTGFVVGAHSLHVSGLRYEAIKGSPQSITQAPQELVELLRKPERETFKIEGVALEASELHDAVMRIENGAHDYSRWLAVGMGLHHATNGGAVGEEIWEKWTIKTGRTDTESISAKWHSFGKSRNPVTEGTLLSWAKDGGYIQSVTFESDVEWDEPNAQPEREKQLISDFNPDNLTGLAGDVFKWIDSQCLFPRKNLSLAAALQVIGNAAGMRYRVDSIYKTTLNLMTFAIADSGSGKEAVYQAASSLLDAAGVGLAVHGGIKSEQELVRNAVRNQASLYMIDEFGAMLSKIGSAKKKGNASYLEAVPAEIMKIFTKANSSYLVSGDMREEIADRADKKIASIQKRLDDGRGGEKAEQELEHAKTEREQTNSGIPKPFLSFFGISEPNSFDAAIRMDPDMLVNGFLGRALLFRESEALPMRRSDYNPRQMPITLSSRLSQLYKNGSAGAEFERVQLYGDEETITVSEDARAELDSVYAYWRTRGLELEHEGQGLHTITTRVWEMVIKIAGILSIPSEMGRQPIVTLDNVRQAHAIVRKVTDFKISHCITIIGADSKDDGERVAGLFEGVIGVLESYPQGIGAGVLRNRNKKYGRINVDKCIEKLIEQKRVKEIEYTDTRNRSQKKYKLI
ncbi:MAG TPA: bifunctional DNA primase/polymerase [Oscillospiraceae bacterium]|nr:bifunctional DNA primase/polymerase [Oscillospiraceae bacterium]